MNVFSRKKNETLIIGDSLTVTVIEICGDKVRLGITQSMEVPVQGTERFDAIHQQEMTIPLRAEAREGIEET